MNRTLCFIGGGNMARALIGGLIARGLPREHICVADPLASQLDALNADYRVRTTRDNTEAARQADVLILAVKPQEIRNATTELRPLIAAGKPLVISVAAGIRVTDLERWTGTAAIVRCMPNRPALLGCGVTAAYAGPQVSGEQRRVSEEILSAVGKVLWLDAEDDLNTVTAISGSGPAYFFLLMEMLERTGVALGLPPDVSRTLATETAFGSGVMARDSSVGPEELRAQVTSKGGTTEAALRRLETHDVRGIFAAAVIDAAQRARDLAAEFGRDD